MDFGLSGRIAEPSPDMIPYADPKCFNNDKDQSENYEPNEKSDVYSIGVLLWQVSSGRQPFRETDSISRNSKW